MTLAEIDALTIESSFNELFPRILDLSVVPVGEPSYMLDQDDTMPFYDRVIVHQNLVKPTLQNFQDELAQYKVELTAEENAKIAEAARVSALNARWNALAGVRGAMDKAGVTTPNPMIELKRIIDENDEATMGLLEVKAVEFDNEVAAAGSRSQRKQNGKLARKVCEGVLDLIAGYNLERTLTTAQIDSLQVTFSDANNYLRSSQPWAAKTAIEAIVPDGTLITQEMKGDGT